MAESSKRAKKRRIVNRLYENFTNYKQCLIVKLENVTSNQIQQARLQLRQKKLGEIVCGKNVRYTFPSFFIYLLSLDCHKEGHQHQT